ncbi:APC family permease [Clostridiisalibacter paucivorans]|uniref:APC family permease n=1 Tax=Clostridiisalibacter paucivorans TaxID=408753 RepID=UPI00047A1911|nr:APC family permease [Clostridiisalibacter paucivorans]
MSENVSNNTLHTGAMGKWTLLAMNVGNMIGAGVVTLVGQAMGMTGHSLWLAYTIALILGAIYNIPVLFVGSTLRFDGGPYALINTMLGKKFAGIYVVSFFMYLPSIALYAVGLGTYVKSIFPNIPIQVTAAVALTVFYCINLFGANFLSRAQNFLVTFLLVGLATFAIMGMSKVDFTLLSPALNDNFMPNGFKGLFKGAFLLMFSTYGTYMVIFFSRHSKQPKKDVPFAIIWTIVAIFLFYIPVSIVASGVLPMSVVANQPLTFVAREILSKPVFIFFMIAAPFMALSSTINSCMCAYTEPLYKATVDGWLPKKFGVTNKNGSPWMIITVVYLCSMIPLVLKWDINTIANTLLLTDLLMGILMMISFALIPKRYPNAWANRECLKNVPNGVFYTAIILASLVQIAIIINSIASIKLYIVIATAVAFAIGIVHAIKKEKDGDIVVPSLEDETKS